MKRGAVLKPWKYKIPKTGYTIVEVLIFLAVSGVLATSAMMLVSGRQARTEFDTTVRDFDSKLQDVINNVATGYYTRLGSDYKCEGHPSGPTRFSSSGAEGQGTSSQCIYLGQVLHFAPQGSDHNKIKIYSVAGSRIGNSGREAEDITDAEPLLISPHSAGNASGADSTEDYALNNGFKIKRVSHIKSGSRHDSAAIGFFTTFGQHSSASPTGDNIPTGDIRTNVAHFEPANQFKLDKGENDMVDQVNNALNKNPPYRTDINPGGGIQICLEGGSGQVAVISILGGGSTTTKVDIYNKVSEANAAPGGNEVCGP